MRTGMVTTIMAAAAIIIVSGAALAAEKPKAAETGSWEYRWALETGTLPASDAGKVQKDNARTDAQVATVEIGGRVYRVGLDTP